MQLDLQMIIISFYFLGATCFLSCLLFATVATAEVAIVGSTYATTRLYATATIQVPPETRPGDLLVVFIGGSGPPWKGVEPSGPLPAEGWREIIRFGPKDINQKAYYKVYGQKSESESDPFGMSRRSTYEINEGKSIFAAMLALRGADITSPIIDSAADGIDTLPGTLGGSRAPAVMAEKGGIVITGHAFDDPLRGVAVITPDVFTVLSFKAVSGDGMAIGATNTTLFDGLVGPIDVIGTFIRGSGNEVAIAISIRPEKSGDKNAAGTNSKSPMPSIAPSITPSLLNIDTPSDAPTDAPTALLSMDGPLSRGSTQKHEIEEEGTGSAVTNNMQREEDGNTPKCGDGTAIVLGETFCYTKIDSSGTYSRNDVKNCSFFELGNTTTRLKNHCSVGVGAGSALCPACKKYLDMDK